MPGYKRYRQRLAAEAIRDGSIKVPKRCPKCSNTGLEREPPHRTIVGERENRLILCVACGARFTEAAIHLHRQKRIKAVINEGIDPWEVEK